MAEATKPGQSADRVLQGSFLLPKTLWATWHAIWPWDQGEKGCTLSAERMRHLVGASAETVEDHRRILARLGLLERTGATKGAGWKCRFPTAVPLPHRDRLTPEETRDCVAQFDAWLQQRADAIRATLPGASPGNQPGDSREHSRDIGTAPPPDSRGASRVSRVIRAEGPLAPSSFSSISSLVSTDQTFFNLLELGRGKTNEEREEGGEKRGDQSDRVEKRDEAAERLTAELQTALRSGNRLEYERLLTRLNARFPREAAS
ncbi:MAG: hypothetical protein HOP28_13845 [Gemmatimonadales bacterium]|nr:hypothetical protein [Gemmatimonadales bacterium]